MLPIVGIGVAALQVFGLIQNASKTSTTSPSAADASVANAITSVPLPDARMQGQALAKV